MTPEIEALLQAPDRSTELGRRDHALLLFAVQTGLRVSELTQLRWEDVRLDSGAHVRCTGKGRKDRCTPLTSETVSSLRARKRELEPQPRSRFSEPAWRADEQRRRWATRHEERRHRLGLLPISEPEARVATHSPSHGRDATPHRRGRTHCHRLVARPRVRGDDRDLRARRSVDQGTRDPTDRAAASRTTAVPSAGSPARVPRRALIMPRTRMLHPRLPPTRHNPVRGIMRVIPRTGCSRRGSAPPPNGMDGRTRGDARSPGGRARGGRSRARAARSPPTGSAPEARRQRERPPSAPPTPRGAPGRSRSRRVV